MTLWVVDNANAGRVVNDIKSLCPDPGLTVEAGSTQIVDPDTGEAVTVRGSGKVRYTQTASSLSCNLMAALASNACTVSIRAENSGFGISDIANPAAGKILSDRGAVTIFDQYPGTTQVQVVYDSLGCNGRGYWAGGDKGSQIDLPTDTILFHELTHALHLCTSGFSGGMGTAEADAVKAENAYRMATGLPLRVGYTGGCKAAAAKKPPPKGQSRGRCFVASAAYGSPLDPQVHFLRQIREQILRKTRPGAEFFDAFYRDYERVSPLLVDLMERDPAVRALVRDVIVTPLVDHLRLLESLPDVSLDSVPEPWRSFLNDTIETSDAWVSLLVDIPLDFKALSPLEAALELAVTLRYMVRGEAARSEYLKDLRMRNQIPILMDPESRRQFSRLAPTGLSQRMIDAILEPARASAGSDIYLHAFGGTELRQRQTFPQDQWNYSVTFTNRTTDVLDEINIFYRQKDLPGVVFLSELGILPGQTRVFNLGLCSMMQGYVLAIFAFGETDPILTLPTEGEMTPARAAQLNPTDTEPCADSWSLNEG